MFRNTKSVLRLAVGLALISSYLWPVLATAATAPAGTGAGQGLEISPPLIELKADPGQTVTTQIKVRNVTNNDLIAKVKADDFQASGEDGQAKLLLNETGQTRYSLKYWVQTVADVRIAPQQIQTFNVAFAVPSNAEPGGHYGVIRFTAVPPDLNGTGVALSASLGSLVLLTVSGNITDNLSVASYQAVHNNYIGSFFETGPIDLVERITNNGSVHERPTGKISVTGMFGKQVGSLVVNDKAGNVLPGSIRRFQETLTSKALLGHYTARMDLVYANGKQLSQSIGFWVIPWKMVLMVIVLLVLLLAGLRYGLRRYNAYILRNSRR